MRRLTPARYPVPLTLLFSCFIFFVCGTGSLLLAADVPTKTIVADLIMVDGDLYIVRGERGEIQIEVTPKTKLSEKFGFGDRIKAVVLPNDVAQSITRAAPDEPVGITTNDPETTPSVPPPVEPKKTEKTDSPPPLQPTHKVPQVRIIIADLLMVDGSFYIVRSEHGEIQIEITPKTQLSEQFKFGDKIKARVTPSDKALSVVRAGKDDPKGIQEEAASSSVPPPAMTPPFTPSSTPLPNEDSSSKDAPSTKDASAPPASSTPSIRTIVADVLMVDGDFFVIRGERGEIRIEVTPKTKISESFDFGDRIKAEVLPNDKALKIERAGPQDILGITFQ